MSNRRWPEDYLSSGSDSSPQANATYSYEKMAN